MNMAYQAIDQRDIRPAAGWCWAALAAAVMTLGPVPNPARGYDDTQPNATPPRQSAPKQMNVTGRIVGPDGKGLAGAHVGILVEQHRRSEKPRGNFYGWGLAPSVKLLASSETDADGRFSISGAGYSPSLPYTRACLIAGAPGCGLVLRDLDTASLVQDVQVTLAPQRFLRGRLIDLQGEPAAGVKIHVVWPDPAFASLRFDKPLEGVLPFWPRSVTSDDKGRFLVRGLGSAKLHIEIRHARLAPQQFDAEPVDPKDSKEVTLSLVGMRRFRGRVRYGDSREPAANARLVAIAGNDEFAMGYQEVAGHTDSRGGFSLNVFPGDFLRVIVHPPEGAPYLMLRQVVPWAQAAKQEITLSLERGIQVSGKVTEAGTGDPVAGARVQFRPRANNNPFYRHEPQAGSGLEENLETAITGADGKFQLAALPGPGHLFVLGPTLDFVHLTTSWGLLEYGKPGGLRYYPDGLAALDLKPGTKGTGVSIELHRGVTLNAQVVGPDGKPVDRFFAYCRSFLPMGYEWWQRENGLEGRNGRLELPGCNPDKPSTVWLIDRTSKFGIGAELSADSARTPATIRLQPCGSAVARFVNKAGKPAAGFFNGKPTPNYYPSFSMVITPGAHMAWVIYSLDDRKDLEADWFAWLHAPAGSPEYGTDVAGRTTFAALVPGATYRIMLPQRPRGGDKEIAEKGYPTKDFTVTPGQTLDLGDITVQDQ
jgi:hypothetical protein